MDPQKIIEQYQKAIIQIAAPSGTGTGFYVKEFNLIVTNDHVVGDNAEVTVAGKAFDKALEIDPTYAKALKSKEAALQAIGRENEAMQEEHF